jgi:hypothetical protein
MAPLRVLKPDRVINGVHSDASDGRTSVATAQNFWGVEEGDSMGEAVKQERRINLATAFDE